MENLLFPLTLQTPSLWGPQSSWGSKEPFFLREGLHDHRAVKKTGLHAEGLLPGETYNHCGRIFMCWSVQLLKLMIVLAQLPLPSSLSLPSSIRIEIFESRRERANYFHYVNLNIIILSVSFLASFKEVNLPVRNVCFRPCRGHSMCLCFIFSAAMGANYSCKYPQHVHL